MHTKDKLAQALRDAGLDEIAARAAAGHYDDYLSPLDTPELALMAELRASGTPDAMALRQRVMDGDFDATSEEADAWAASPEGQATFAMFTPGQKARE